MDSLVAKILTVTQDNPVDLAAFVLTMEGPYRSMRIVRRMLIVAIAGTIVAPSIVIWKPAIISLSVILMTTARSMSTATLDFVIRKKHVSSMTNAYKMNTVILIPITAAPMRLFALVIMTVQWMNTASLVPATVMIFVLSTAIAD